MEREQSKQTEKTLNNEMARVEELHARETKLSQDVNMQYKTRTEGHVAKIGHLKMALDELKGKTEMGTKCI